MDDKNQQSAVVERPDSVFFATPDLFQTAYFVARNHPVVKIEWKNHALFFFERTAALETDLADFHLNAPIGIRDLIGGIYSAKRQLREFERRKPCE